MKIARFVNFWLLVTITLPPFCIRAQGVYTVPEPWLTRAQTTTEDLVKDAGSLTRSDRALLWGRLGNAWWNEDSVRAHTWMQKAVEEVKPASDHESAAERQQRLSTARSLLGIVAQRDKSLSTELTLLLAYDAERAPDRDRSDDANALIDVALAVLNTDPKHAAELGSASLRISPSYRIAALLWRLRSRDKKVGDALFNETLILAKATNEKNLFDSLASVAFRGPVPSDELRRRLLSVLAEILLRVPSSASDEATVCRFSSTVAPLLDEFLRLLPLQWGAVRAAMQRCQTTLPSFSRKSVEEALRDQPLKTVADLESEADKASSQEIRDEYLIRAASLASQEKNFERALLLLDRISDQGRKQLGGGWESWRWEYASSAAVTHLKAGDRSAMHKVIAATPVTLRALVQIGVAQELVKAGDRDSAFELLSEARQRLAQSSGTEVVYGYFSLLRQYERLMPLDTISVFNEAVKAINRSEKSDPKASPTLESEASLLTNDILLGPYKVPVGLLERDEPGIRVAISSIESPTKRVAIRLNLLVAALERHRTITPVNRPATPKAGHLSD